MTILFLAQLLVSQYGEANCNCVVGLHFGLCIHFGWCRRQLTGTLSGHTICKQYMNTLGQGLHSVSKVTAFTWYEDAHRASHEQIRCLYRHVVLATKHIVAVTRLHIQVWALWQINEVAGLSLNCVLAAWRIRTACTIDRTDENIVSGACRIS